jgi:hypothetical protein
VIGPNWVIAAGPPGFAAIPRKRDVKVVVVARL